MSFVLFLFIYLKNFFFFNKFFYVIYNFFFNIYFFCIWFGFLVYDYLNLTKIINKLMSVKISNKLTDIKIINKFKIRLFFNKNKFTLFMGPGSLGGVEANMDMGVGLGVVGVTVMVGIFIYVAFFRRSVSASERESESETSSDVDSVNESVEPLIQPPSSSSSDDGGCPPPPKGGGGDPAKLDSLMIDPISEQVSIRESITEGGLTVTIRNPASEGIVSGEPVPEGGPDLSDIVSSGLGHPSREELEVCLLKRTKEFNEMLDKILVYLEDSYDKCILDILSLFFIDSKYKKIISFDFLPILQKIRINIEELREIYCGGVESNIKHLSMQELNMLANNLQEQHDMWKAKLTSKIQFELVEISTNIVENYGAASDKFGMSVAKLVENQDAEGLEGSDCYQNIDPPTWDGGFFSWAYDVLKDTIDYIWSFF